MTAPARHQSEPATQEVLAGLVERVTFHNSDNGFCVLRARARGHRDLVTVIGHAAIISAGEWITALGEWVNDHTHGQQFKARFMRTSAPTSWPSYSPTRRKSSRYAPSSAMPKPGVRLGLTRVAPWSRFRNKIPRYGNDD